MSKQPNILTIAGSDSSGGAGIQADIRTATALNVYAASVITNITAQNSRGVQSVHPLSAEVVNAQLEAVLSDIQFDAIKIGMLYSKEIIDAVSYALQKFRCNNIVIDPVMISSSGTSLLDDSAKRALINSIFPLSTVVTPNLPEADDLLKSVNIDAKTITPEEKAILLNRYYKCAFLVKGGHGEHPVLTDYLYFNASIHSYAHKKTITQNTHGTGCTLSSAICAYLARGYELPKATELAINFTGTCIKKADLLNVGKLYGPVNQMICLE